MRFVSEKASGIIDRLLTAPTDNFVELVSIADLNPGTDFRHTHLRGIDFAGSDLSSFDFTGAKFESCRFEGASIGVARFDGASFRDCGLANDAGLTSWVASDGAEVMKAVSLASARPIRMTFPRGAHTPDAWHIRCLCEIANFGTLRRQLGPLRLDALVQDLEARIASVWRDARTSSPARWRVEVRFECNTLQAATDEIEKLREGLLQPINIDGTIYQLQIQIGVAAAPLNDCDEVRLAEAVESALERALVEERVVMLDLTRADLAFDKLTLMRELPRAIAAGELFMQYQPKVHIRRQEIASAEALVRWEHPVRGLILPSDFIAIDQQAGEIAALTLWMLRQVIGDQRALSAIGHDLILFVNIPGALVADVAFVEEAYDLVRSCNAKIGFEITETAMIRDPEGAIRNLQRLADGGIALAIDDFGTGYSNLTYLKRVPACELKIDKSIVGLLAVDDRSPLVIRSTIDLAHALELEVVAQGVDTPSQLALLGVMGCDLVQGFLVSRPLGLEAFEKHLMENDLSFFMRS